jgi:hypothetical protein
MTTTLNLVSIKPSLDKLQTLERELAASLIERDEAIRASLVALLSRQHMEFSGLPEPESRRWSQVLLNVSVRTAARGCETSRI